jgi:hypothetical protein
MVVNKAAKNSFRKSFPCQLSKSAAKSAKAFFSLKTCSCFASFLFASFFFLGIFYQFLSLCFHFIGFGVVFEPVRVGP